MMTRFLSFSFGSLALAGATSLVGCSDEPAPTPPATQQPDPGCVSRTCLEMGKNCGQIIDDCGQIIECGTCAAGETCGAAGPNQCAIGTCTPNDCAAAGKTCGLQADGCGTVWECGPACVDGTGGTGGSNTGTGGSDPGSGGTNTVPDCDWTMNFTPSQLGSGTHSGTGSTTERYEPKADVQRSGVNYKLLPNGWGPNFQSHTVSWTGTQVTVSVNGSKGDNHEPASFPTMFCGNYSEPVESSQECGLPASISGTSSLEVGLSWAANGNTSDYNTAIDVWLGDGYNIQSYLMVWLRYPEGERPAGFLIYDCATVEGQPGVWEVWAGEVLGRPIITYTRPQGMDIPAIEVDIKAFYDDAMARPDKTGWKTLVGSQFNSVAGGFEVWQSVSNLEMTDFYVDVN